MLGLSDLSQQILYLSRHCVSIMTVLTAGAADIDLFEQVSVQELDDVTTLLNAPFASETVAVRWVGQWHSNLAGSKNRRP